MATPGIHDSLSAVKPGTYSPLSEGSKGGREISSTYTLFLFQIRHFILTDLRLALSRGRGGERYLVNLMTIFTPRSCTSSYLVTIVNTLYVEALDLLTISDDYVERLCVSVTLYLRTLRY